MPLQIRRGTNAEREALIPSNGLVVGELLYVTDSQQVYIGTGNSGEHQGLAVTGYTNENAVDAVGAALVAGSHTSISFTYGTAQDIAGRIDATVDLSNYSGTITADAFKGSVFGDDTTMLVNAIDGTFNLNGTIKDDIVPSTLGLDLGSSGTPFNNVYVGGTLRIGAASITAVSTAIDLPAGSTINGVPLAIPGATSLTVDITGSVFGDDSTQLVDAVSSLILGDVNNNVVNTKRVNISATDTIDVGILINTNAGGGDGVDLFNINSYHDEVDAIGAFFSRSKGTYAAPTTLTNGDSIFKLVFAGTTTDSTLAPAAAILGGVDGTVGAGVLPGNIGIYTTTAAGDLTPKLIIGPDGQQTVVAPALVAGGASGQVNTGTISSWMKVSFNGVEYAVPMYAIRP